MTELPALVMNAACIMAELWESRHVLVGCLTLAGHGDLAVHWVHCRISRSIVVLLYMYLCPVFAYILQW